MESITTVKNSSTKVLLRKALGKDAVITLYANSVFEVIWDESLRVIEKKHLVKIRELIEQMGKGKQLLVYFSTNEFLTISKEAREYGASLKAQEYTIANAVLIDSLAKKIIFNFFLRINKPNKPTRGFNSKSKAIEWLLQLKRIGEN